MILCVPPRPRPTNMCNVTSLFNKLSNHGNATIFKKIPLLTVEALVKGFSNRNQLMQPKDLMSMLLVGKDFEYVLFKTAIFFAESGINVWFISPIKFTKIPKEIKHPGKEVLQQITFMYLKDHTDLTKQLNGIHLWHKQPGAIIVSHFGDYCNFPLGNSQAAFISTNLIDSIATCANKKREKVFLLLACNENIESNQLCLLRDLYFPNMISKKDDSSCFDDVRGFFKQF